MTDIPNDDANSTAAANQPPAADAVSGTGSTTSAGEASPGAEPPPTETAPAPPPAAPPPPEKEIDLTKHDPSPSKGDSPPVQSAIREVVRDPQEEVRGDLARGLLWLLTLTIGGVMLFVGTGQIKSEVLTQSIFPSLVTLAGTALGFYFGAQSSKDKSNSGQ